MIRSVYKTAILYEVDYVTNGNQEGDYGLWVDVIGLYHLGQGLHSLTS